MSYQIFVTVVGAKQGTFKGEEPGRGSTNRIPLVGFDYGVAAPYDPASGLITGRRQHKPVTLTKPWGVSTPQFLSAAYANETLKSVLIQFTSVAPDGKEEVDHTITLTNATILSVEDSVFLGEAGSPQVDSRELDRIVLSFEKIQISSVLGSTNATDDWQSPLA